jgi:hypothetical protein
MSLSRHQLSSTNTSISRSQKSTTQKAGDTLRGGSDETKESGKSIGQTVSDTAASATQSVKDTLSSLTGNK